MVAPIAERPHESTQDVEQVLPRSDHVARPLPRPVAAIAVAFAGRAAGGAALALAPAQALAARLDAELIVMQVQLTDVDGGDLLCRAVALTRRKGLPARGRQVVVGASTPESTAQALVAAVQETGASLLVMAGRDASRPATDVDGTGEVVEAVVRLSPIPVLLVPPGYGARDGDGALRFIGWEGKTLAARRAGAAIAPLRLTVALDGSPDATAPLPLVSTWTRALGAEVSLVRVAPRGAVLHGSQLHGNQQHGTDGARSSVNGVDASLTYLQRVALRLQADSVAADAIHTAVCIGPVADALLAHARREQASILVLSRRPCRCPTGSPRDSVTAEVMRRAALPVLLVPVT